MRAYTERKHKMGKRYAIVIGVAAAGVMALGAQTATSSTGEPVDSVKLDLQLSGVGGTHELKKQSLDDAVLVKASCSDEACTARAEGKLTKVKNDKLKPASADLVPGEKTKLELGLTPKTRRQAHEALDKGKNVQAKVTVEATDAAGNVATAKRTIKILPHPPGACVREGHRPGSCNSSAAQTATAGGEPDLQLSGKKKQELGNAVKVKASCGDDACTASGGGTLAYGGPRLHSGDLIPASADLGPGETTTLKLKLSKKTRQKAGKALDKGNKVQAHVIADATDAVGDEAHAKRTITLVK